MAKDLNDEGHNQGRLNGEYVQIEYSALSSSFNTVVSFRLTLLGFYLAAIGLIVQSNWPLPIFLSLLGIVLTFALYLFELRTRVLYWWLGQRGVYIEQDLWGYKHNPPPSEGAIPFFSRQFPQYWQNTNSDRSPDYTQTPEYFASTIKILHLVPIRSKWISHSLALDVLYLGVLGFFATAIINALL